MHHGLHLSKNLRLAVCVPIALPNVPSCGLNIGWLNYRDHSPSTLTGNPDCITFAECHSNETTLPTVRGRIERLHLRSYWTAWIGVVRPHLVSSWSLLLPMWQWGALTLILMPDSSFKWARVTWSWIPAAYTPARNHGSSWRTHRTTRSLCWCPYKGTRWYGTLAVYQSFSLCLVEGEKSRFEGFPSPEVDDMAHLNPSSTASIAVSFDPSQYQSRIRVMELSWKTTFGGRLECLYPYTMHAKMRCGIEIEIIIDETFMIYGSYRKSKL